jgi:hypothetical protein
MVHFPFRRQNHKSTPNLVIAQRVIDKMAAAAGRYIADETGEALIGLMAPGLQTNGVPTIYVLETIAPDESAVREWATFQQGDETQAERFWWLLENWRSLRENRHLVDGRPLPAKWDVPLIHVGDWHKQPGFMIQPSTGDLMTARIMLEDPEAGMEFLIAPILTVGHPSGEENPPGSNYITVPQDDSTCMRVDFWYLDRESRDFQAIHPAVYPDDQLPGLPAYPWHMLDTARVDAEYQQLDAAGVYASPPILWNAHGQAPLDVCLLVTYPGWPGTLLLITRSDYPHSAPAARTGPRPVVDPIADPVAAFEYVWPESKALAVEGYPWAASRESRLHDFLLAAVDQLGWQRPAKPAAPTDEGHP